MPVAWGGALRCNPTTTRPRPAIRLTSPRPTPPTAVLVPGQAPCRGPTHAYIQLPTAQPATASATASATAVVSYSLRSPHATQPRTTPTPCTPQGPDAGKVEPLLTNIAGIPDGVSTSSDGHFWVALYSPPVKGHQIMHHYIIKLLLAWLPKSEWRRLTEA